MMMLIFLVILLICSNPWFQTQVAKMIGKENPTEFSGLLIALFFAAVLFMLHKYKKISEPFLFQVSKFNPRCSGLYFGKPTTFQYDRIGCNYNPPITQNNPDMIENKCVDTPCKSVQDYCKEQQNPPLGYIGTDKDTFYEGDPHLFPNFGDTK